MSETIYRHKKRGTTYTMVGEAELQTSESLPEGSMLVVYRCQETGNLWARPRSEFTDGRFEKIKDEGGYLTAAPSPVGEVAFCADGLPRCNDPLCHPTCRWRSNVPSPVGEVGELVKRLRNADPEWLPCSTGQMCEEAADALTAQAARLAECERERDEARKDLERTIGQLHRMQDRYEATESRADLLHIALSGLLDDIEQRTAAYRSHPSPEVRSHYKSIPLSDGRLYQARAALSPEAP